MPKIISIPSRKIEAEFPDSMPDEEIKSILQQKFPRNGDDVAYDVSQFTNIADTRDFIANMPDDDYIMLNNYKADKKLSWGELAGVAGDAIGTIVGDVVKGAGASVTKAGKGVAESAARGVAAGTVDIVNLGQKLITPNERIPTFEEFMQTPRTQLGYAYGTAPTAIQVQPTEQDYKNLIDQQRQMELQSLDLADVSEKLIQGAPVPEVAKGASYLDAVTLAGLAKSVAKSGVKSIYKAAAKQPLTTVAAVAPDVVPEMTAKGIYTGVETGASVIPQNMMRNAEQFATKVGEGARKAGLTGVQLGAGTVKGAADLGKGVINVANKLGLENAALRGTIGGAVGYQEGGTEGAILGTVIGSALPVTARAALTGASRTADFIGAAAKVAKSGPSRTGIFEKMATATNISPEARKVAEKVLFTQPFVQYASDATKQAAKSAMLGVPAGAALGYAADGEEGAAAGAGVGFAIGGMSGALDASVDAMKSIAGRSTARNQRNATGDINSFVNDITDDQARSDYGEIMNRAIQIAGPERAADMLDSLRLAEGMGANVKVDKKAFNSFSYDDTNGGTITINPDRMNAGSIQHEVFHQLFNVGVRGELQKALSDVYLPKKDADGNIIQNGLFDDKEFAKKAAELAEKYKGNEKGYKQALEAASVLDNPAGFSPEAVDNARAFVIDEMTAYYTEKFMGRSRPGVFNPDRLPLWHRQILENIDDKILNSINDKIFANKSVKDPTAFFTDAEGKPVRVPQIDKVLNRAFKNQLGRGKGVVGKPREVVVPKNPRELGSWAAATFGATRDVLDPTGQRPLTEQERKVITAADFDAAKALYQSLPDDAKQTVRVTKKSGVPTDINSKGARIEITSQTPSNVFESFLQVAKDRGMGNQQLANMRQLYAAMAMDDGPTFDTVNNPVYKYDPKTGKMTPGVRPATRQEVYPTAITVNSAGGFNVEYIDLSRVKANAQKILDNPKYKGVWNGLDDFMTDFGSSLRNLSKGESAAIPSAELLGKGNAKVGAMKRDLIAEAMNVTLPKRLEYINQPTIDPLTLATKEGKDRRTEGSAFRDFRIERLTNVTPTNNRLKMVKEDAYDIFVQRFQPDAFTPETLPNGEAFTNPDGYRILNKAGSKLFRTYDDTGKLIGIAESKEKAMKKAQDEFAKKAMKNNKSWQRDNDFWELEGSPPLQLENGIPPTVQEIVFLGKKDLPKDYLGLPDEHNSSGLSNSFYPIVGFKMSNGSIIADRIRISDHPQVSRNAPRHYDVDIRAWGDDETLLAKKAFRKLIQKHEQQVKNQLNQSVAKRLEPLDAPVAKKEINAFIDDPERAVQQVSKLLDTIKEREANGKEVPTGKLLEKARHENLTKEIPESLFTVKNLEGLKSKLTQIIKNQAMKEEPAASKSPTEMRFQPVTPEQDAAFLAAAKAGDTETAQRMVDDVAFDQTSLSSEDVLRLIDRNSPSMALDYRAISKALGDKKYILEKVPVNSLRFEEGSENVVDAKRASPSKGPIIIGVDGVIVDGRHRAMLAKQNKQETISAYIPQNTDPITYDDAGNIIPLSQRFNQASPDIRFQPDPTSPNILNGTDGSRIIKSDSGKYRVYLATGALAGVKDSLESAQKLVQSKSKSYATN